MSTDSGVIREFLVQLGFRIEDQQKFEISLQRATKVAAELGAAMAAVGAAVTAAVVKVSDQFESLYYSSQRVRASVGNIKAFDYAISQMGGTAQAAQQSLEAFGDFLRVNPAGEGILSALGVKTRDAKGNLRQTTDMLAEFGRVAKSMPLYQARGYAHMLGIDDRTLDALMRGIIPAMHQYRGELKKAGIDADSVAEASARWMQRWRLLSAQITLFADKLVLMLQGPMGRAVEWFRGADKATHGLSTALLALGALLAPLLLVLDPVVVAVLALTGAVAALAATGQFKEEFGQLGKDFGDLTKDVGDLANALKVNLGPAFEATFRIALNLLDGTVRELDHVIRMVNAIGRRDWKAASEEAKLAVTESNAGRIVAGAANAYAKGDAEVKKPLGPIGPNVAARIKQYHDYLRARGLDEPHAQGVLAGIFAENTSLDPNAQGPMTKGGRAMGLGQWLRGRKDKIVAKYGKNPTWQQQLDFLVSELKGGDQGGVSVMGARTPDEILYNYITKFMRPNQANGEVRGDLLRGHKFLLGNPFGAPQVAINQHTTINVNGARDPHATARAVAGEQGRVNGNLVRHTKAAAT